MARRTPRLGFAAVAICAAVVVAGCEEPLPAAPTFELDVKPIFLARCVRCHGAGGTLNSEPLTAVVLGTPSHAYLAYYEDDFSGCPAPPTPQEPSLTCRQGAKSSVGTIKVYIHGTGLGRMPPPPADALSSREVELVDRWIANQAPP